MIKKIYLKIKAFSKDNLSLFIILVLIVLFFFAYLFNNIVITIHSGQAGVYYSRFDGGTKVDRVYDEGIHFIYPWDKLYIYNVRVQEYFHEFDVLTKNGLTVHLLISIRYYPEYHLLGMLHKKVGPDYLNKVVVPEIEAVLRIIIGKINAEEVYTTKTSLIEESLNEAIEQVSQRFVIVDDVIIKRVTLPPSVQKAIQYKEEQKHLAEAHDFKILREKKERERKTIEADAYRKYNRIIASSLTAQILDWKAIQAALELSRSPNTKVVVLGSGKRGLPVLGSLLLDAPSNIDFSNKTASSSEKKENNEKDRLTPADTPISADMTSDDAATDVIVEPESMKPIINDGER